jgi:hypothetical protein
MRILCSGVLVFALTLLTPRPSAAQNRGDVDFVSGFSLNQGASLTGSSAASMNFAGRVAFNLVPGLQVVGEVGRIGNVLPPLTTDLLAFAPFDLKASAIYGEGGVRALMSPRSSVSPYVEATAGMARMNVRVDGLSATESDLLNLGLGFTNSTSPVAGIGGGVMLRAGRMSFDIGYRYKKIFARDFVASLLADGSDSLQSHSVTFGVGVRF